MIKQRWSWAIRLAVCVGVLSGCAGEYGDEGLELVDAGADEEGDAGTAAAEDDQEEEGERARLKAAALNIDVIKTGSGSGTVVGNDLLSQVINCGTKCNQGYLLPTTVNLRATASSGSVFAGWSGGCSGTAPTCSVTVGLPGVDVYARFEALRTLTVSKTGGTAGTVTGTRTDTGATVINCGSDCSETVPNGTRITLRAVPATNAQFLGWSGACSGTATTCTVTMSAARSVQAAFRPRYQVTVTKSLLSGSTVSGVTADTGLAVIVCGSDCSELVQPGTRITFRASGNVSAEFVSWYVGGLAQCRGTLTCTITINQNTQVRAIDSRAKKPS